MNDFRENIEREWNPLKDYEGLYEITQNGRVRSIKHKLTNKEKPEYRILKTRINNDGYVEIRLSKNCKVKTTFIHVLIAKNFILNSDCKQEVNHINGIKTDNRIENLEWISHSANIKHAYKMGLIKGGNRCAKVIDICTGRKFNSIKEAAKVLSINYNTCRNLLSGYNKQFACLQYLAS